MVTGTRDYTHQEHTQALQNSLRFDSLGYVTLAVLARASFGETHEQIADHLDMKTTGVNSAMKRARDALLAPNDASATYNAFALELLDDTKRLNSKDIEVLRMLASGYTRTEIAEYLGYRGEARRNPGALAVNSVIDKLGTRTEAEAVRLGVRFGLLLPEVGDPPLPEWPE